MSGSKTQYLSQALLNHVLGNTPYTAPANVFIALSNSPFDPTSTGTALDELTEASYARVEVTNDATEWPAASAAVPAVKSNANDVVYATATEVWTAPQSVYVCDAGTGGNALYGADLTSSTDVEIGDQFKILAGTFIFSED